MIFYARSSALALLSISSLLVLSAPALAAEINCEPRESPSDRCFGTADADVINGTETTDFIHARGGDDQVLGKGGSDRLGGGPDDDMLNGGTTEEGAGGDVYVFKSGFGHDTIVDAPIEGVGGNTVRLGYVEEDLRIHLTSVPDRHEVRTTDDSSTINWGTSVIDRVWAGQGSDRVRGNTLRNVINVGAGGSDVAFGGNGADWLNGRDTSSEEKSSDTLYGGMGDDRIDVIDRGVVGPPDVVDCGAGKQDTVLYDFGVDVVTNCEILVTS